MVGLQLYKDFLTYWVISNESYYLVIESFSNMKIEFAKAIINGEEMMIKHSLNEKRWNYDKWKDKIWKFTRYIKFWYKTKN